MDIAEASTIYHVGIVLLVLWLLAEFNWCHPLAYLFSLIYLYLVHERYVMRLWKKLQFEGIKQANQRRVLSDSETVRWLNHAVEEIWPICMERIASQKILLPIMPWFLEKYKPWPTKKVVVQHLYLGRNAPMFTSMRVLHQTPDDDHLVLELGMNFCTADDMSAILSVQLRNRLGLGMSVTLHLTSMHLEGKILIGVKFLRDWPYLGRLQLCFVEPPYFQMTVKPIFSHGIDVTKLPGIDAWLDKLLSIAFEQTLVKKFASGHPGNFPDFGLIFGTTKGWFSVDEKEPVAYAKVEVVEASDMKPSDLINGLADPYVKGRLGAYRFRTEIQKKTLNPKWREEFKIPIVTWESPNILALAARDKDHYVDDILGDCSVSINDLRDGQRHDMWLRLQNVKTGRLHLAVTIVEKNVDDNRCDWESFYLAEKRNSFATETSKKSSFSSEKSPRVADEFEPIDIEGQKETGIWVQRPGSEVSRHWEPRKGKTRCLDIQIPRELNDVTMNSSLAASGSHDNNSSNPDEDLDDDRPMSTVQRGLRKISSAFHRSPKEDQSTKSVTKEDLAAPSLYKIPKERDSSGGESDLESPVESKLTDKAKNFKHIEKSAESVRQALSCKGFGRSTNSPVAAERRLSPDADSSDDESLPPLTVETIPVASKVIITNFGINSSRSPDDVVLQTGKLETAIDAKSPTNKVMP